MTDDNHEGGQDMMEIDFSEMNMGNRHKGHRSRTHPSHSQRRKKVLLFTGAVLLIISFIIGITFIAGSGSSGKPITILQTRIRALEERVAHLNDIKGNIATVQQQKQTLQRSLSELRSSLKSMEGKLRHVSEDVERLKNRMGSAPGLEKNALPIKKELINKAHPRYHVVRKGESLYKIAKKYGLSLRELYHLSKLTSKSVIHPGQKLILIPDGKN